MKRLLFTLLLLGCGSAPDEPTASAAPPEGPDAGADASAGSDGGAAPELHPIRVFVDGGVTRSAEVRAGVDGWARVTEPVRAWSYVDTLEEADLGVYEIGPHARLCDAQETTHAFGCAQVLGGLWEHESGDALLVFLTTGEYEQNPALVTMHETGHLLGLTHEDGGIMQGGATKELLARQWLCPDARTVERLGELLDLTGLTTCEGTP